MKITASCFQQVKETVGFHPAETGALLAGPLDGPVTHVHFDEHGARGRAEYSPDVTTLNKVLKEWPKDVRLKGFVHSHPSGFVRPSHADIEYAVRIIGANKSLPGLVLPIVQSASDVGDFGIFGYSVGLKRGKAQVIAEPVDIVPDQAQTRLAVTERAPGIFDRVWDAYDVPRLAASLVVVAGVGGAASFVENLARAGVGHFVLVDPDVVTVTNLATQAYFYMDIGKPKVCVLADRIRSINPSARVTVLQKCLEDLTVAELEAVQFAEGYSARLLVAMTDSFRAQAAANRLALVLRIPLVAGQVYHEGRGAELVFTVPGVTPACARCALSGRYEQYENGFSNNVTSHGSPIFSGERLNVLAGVVAMGILHHGTNHPRWGNLIERIGNRNLLQIRLTPDIGDTLGIKCFDRIFNTMNTPEVFFDETAWRPVKPDNPENGFRICPDCGGTGDLRHWVAGK